jgi:hypothetical protein
MSCGLECFARVGVLAILAVLVLSGCGLRSVPEVPVAEQWTRTVNNFSLIPIYPMRENVYVGDIRLTVDSAAVERGIVPYRNLGHLKLNGQLDEYYRGRPSLPHDKGFDGRRDPTAPWEQPTSADSIYVPVAIDPANTNRLRLAALPGVKVATVAQGSLGGRVPLQGWGQIGGGLAARGTRLLDISLTGIEEAEAPSDYMVKAAFDAYCEREKFTSLSKASLEFSLAQLIPPARWNPGIMQEVRPQIAILNRVLYARAIDYTFKTAEGYGADIAAVVGPLKDLQALSQSVGASAKSPPGTELVGAAGTGTIPLAKELAALVASLRSTLSASASPGVALSTVFVDARGVTLRDIYLRPLAFAAQAVALDADPSRFENICDAPPTSADPERPFTPVFQE